MDAIVLAGLDATAAVGPWLLRGPWTGYNGPADPWFIGGRGHMTTMWNEMGWDGERIWRETVKPRQTTKASNRLLVQGTPGPRLQRLGLISDRIADRYGEIGLL